MYERGKLRKTLLLALALILSIMNFSSLTPGGGRKQTLARIYAAFADIRPDGSMKIEEYIAYRFSGTSPNLKRRMDTLRIQVDELSIYSVEELIWRTSEIPGRNIQQEDYNVTIYRLWPGKWNRYNSWREIKVESWFEYTYMI